MPAEPAFRFGQERLFYFTLKAFLAYHSNRRGNMAEKMWFSLVIPCYNEETVFDASMPKIVSALKKTRKPFEIIFVDDKSKDRTAELVKRFAEKNFFTKTIFHSKNKGRGRSVMDGIKAASGTYCGFLDIDLEVSADHIPQAIEKLEQGFDVVIGSRRPQKSPWFRTLLHYIYARFMGILLGIQFSDTNAGYKFFRTGSYQ